MIGACGTVGAMPLVTLSAPRIDRGVEVDDLIRGMLARDAAVACGVSGGKDSCALAFAVWEHLDRIGHTGPRCLVHADLGVVEWADSAPTCDRLARALGTELLTVRRPQGDMLDRWRQRWHDNVRRYATLSCVKLILPWSTPDMRFCTSELKVAQINKGLVERWPGREIVSAAGIRRDESPKRSKAPISKPDKGLAKTRARTTGASWNPILAYTGADVRAVCKHRGFDLHEGYTRWNMKRVSCMFCIMQDMEDMSNSVRVPEHAPVYRAQVDLEIVSTFAFQGDRWLGDLAPHLLSPEQIAGIVEAKRRGALREAIEADIPEHLLYEKGWPNVMPTVAEAEMLASKRRAVAEAVQLEIGYTTGAEVHGRYAELMDLKATRN